MSKVRKQKQEAKRQIAKTSIDRIQDVFRHNGCSDPEASFEKGSDENKQEKRKSNSLHKGKWNEKKKKKAAELEDGRKTVLGMSPTKSLPSLD